MYGFVLDSQPLWSWVGFFMDYTKYVNQQIIIHLIWLSHTLKCVLRITKKKKTILNIKDLGTSMIASAHPKH